MSDQQKRLEQLRKMLYANFPDLLYTGAITHVDNGPWPEELDEEEALVKVLKWKKWTEVPDDFINWLPDGYLLMTFDAFAAYFPAWMLQSLKNLESENTVREFLVYSFQRTDFFVPRLRKFNAKQRETVYAFLKEFLLHETSSFGQEHVANALAKLSKYEADTLG